MGLELGAVATGPARRGELGDGNPREDHARARQLERAEPLAVDVAGDPREDRLEHEEQRGAARGQAALPPDLQ
jgi:hypothetical protein